MALVMPTRYWHHPVMSITHDQMDLGEIAAESASLPGAEPFLLYLLTAGLHELVRTPCGSARSPVYSIEGFTLLDRDPL